MGNAFLENRVAIVTGASQGIGKATALALAQHGARVALAARSIPKLTIVAREIERLGSEALVTPCDVEERNQIEGTIAATLEKWGRIDILVANAGQYIQSPARELTLEIFERSMAVNFYGAVDPALKVLPHMLAQKSGHIVFMNSMISLVPVAFDTPYCCAKRALTGFADSLRRELIGSGVHFTSIFPGRVDTPLISHLKFSWFSAKIPPETVAKATIRAIRSRKANLIVIPFQAMVTYYATLWLPAKIKDRLTWAFHLQGWKN